MSRHDSAPSFSEATSRQSSATTSAARQHDKVSSLRAELVMRNEPSPARGDDGPHTSTDPHLSSDESDGDDEDKRRLARARRANTLSKDYTEDEETAVIKKFDRKLVLFLAFLYLLSFLDRSSMPNCPRRMVTSDRRRHW